MLLSTGAKMTLFGDFKHFTYNSLREERKETPLITVKCCNDQNGWQTNHTFSLNLMWQARTIQFTDKTHTKRLHVTETTLSTRVLVRSSGALRSGLRRQGTTVLVDNYEGVCTPESNMVMQFFKVYLASMWQRSFLSSRGAMVVRVAARSK